MAVAGVLVVGCFLAGITPPMVPAPGGVHALSEMSAAAAGGMCVLGAAPPPTRRF